MFGVPFSAPSAGSASSRVCVCGAIYGETNSHRATKTTWLQTFLHLRCWNEQGKALALLLPSFTGWCGWHQDCLQSEILKCSFAGWVSEEFERVLEIGRVYLCQSSECDASSLLMCLWSFACNIRKVRVPFSVLFSCPGMSSWVFSLLLTSDHVLNCQHVLVSNIVS